MGAPRGSGAARFLSATAGFRGVALDTNVCIYYLGGLEPRMGLVRSLLRRARSGALQIELPGIVELELMVRPYASGDPRELLEVQGLTISAPGVTAVPISREIILASAEARALTRLKVPDALVVGSAIVMRCDAIVGNDERFRIINQLSPQRWLSFGSRRVSLPRYVHLDDYLEGG